MPTRRLTGAPPKASVKKDSSPRSSNAHAKSRSSLSSHSIDNARFVPGTILAERYRIVGLLGRGGMGEVYRADDLKLSQSVALKFLPEGLATDGATLARFHREVRVARQVSHRNVCRVYDIGEVDGQQFLSMEYIRGEELSSLLRRIGRLPSDKAIEIARQLCAGLAAAHENGVLHRDLKPANVMIDGDGNVRILDFGLAGLVEEFADDEVRAGTPAYMAPEQLNGEELTTRSDIYSLGLVLYEVFTGKRAFEATSLVELVELRRTGTMPSSPANHVKDIDPLVERVILRCLEKEPRERPASALQVAAALPGGDPLAAALAAGETPSPEMVAAAPKEGALKPPVAVALLAGVLVMLALGSFLSSQTALYRMVPLEKSPEVLKERAREVARKLGYADAPTDSAYGLYPDRDYLDYVVEHDQSRSRWDKLRTGQPTAIYFWYRQSPRYIVASGSNSISSFDPPQTFSGMLSIYLDTQGSLHLLGIRYSMTSLVWLFTSSLFLGFVFLFLLVLLYMILRRKWLAASLLWLIHFSAISLGTSDKPSVRLIFVLTSTLLYITCMYRYGLLASIATLFFFHAWVFLPITTELSAWYAGDYVVALIVYIALAFYGFYTSLAGQPLFRSGFLQD